MEFVDAEYVAPKGGPGRTAGPNPYAGVIAAIALKTVERDGKTVPVAKAVTLTHEANDEARGKAIASAKRKLSNAGHDNTPEVTVATDKGTPVTTSKGTKTTLTFWTVKRQNRTRTVVAATPAK